MMKAVPAPEAPEASSQTTNQVDPLTITFARLRGDLADLAELARGEVIPPGRVAVALAMEATLSALDDAELLCTRLREER